MVDLDTDYPWAYECKKCGDIVPVEDVATHRGRHDDVAVTMTRVDL